MKKVIIYIILAASFWILSILPALATNFGQPLTMSATKSGQAISAQSQTAETKSPTKPATALLLGAGLIGLVTFSRNRLRD
jgi:hypothetical protein